MRTINIEKFCFETSITVYLKNAWCLIYTILHQSIVIQGNSVGALFDGLLAELLAVLDKFFTSPTSDYIGVVGGGQSWGSYFENVIYYMLLITYIQLLWKSILFVL